jgi:GGDEF domain-containing protein
VFGCTASIGIAVLDARSEHTERIELLIERADRAMYRAKGAGKDRVARAEDHADAASPRAAAAAC